MIQIVYANQSRNGGAQVIWDDQMEIFQETYESQEHFMFEHVQSIGPNLKIVSNMNLQD